MSTPSVTSTTALLSAAPGATRWMASAAASKSAVAPAGWIIDSTLASRERSDVKSCTMSTWLLNVMTMISSAGSSRSMKWRRASSTSRALLSMLALTSRASAMRSGRRSPLKNVTSCRLPSSRTWKSSPWSPITGWPVLSSTDTGTRTVRVLAPKVGPWATGPAGGKEESPPARADRGVAGADGAPLAGATRRTATISVSEAPASRSALSRGRSSSSPNPRSRAGT